MHMQRCISYYGFMKTYELTYLMLLCISLYLKYTFLKCISWTCAKICGHKQNLLIIELILY